MVWWTFQSLVVAALLAGLVQVLCRTCPIGPVARHALWLVVLLKLLTPPVVAWPWAVHDPLSPILKQHVPEQVKVVDKIPPTGVSVAASEPPVTSSPPQADIPAADVFVTPDEDAPAVVADQPAPPLPSAHAPEAPTAPRAAALSVSAAPSVKWSLASLVPLAAWIWVIGGALFAAVQLARLIRMALLVRCSTPADKALVDCACKLAARLGIRPVRVRVVGGIVSPMIWAMGRPELLWPERLPAGMAEHSVRGLIVHELAHVKRRDHWVGWLELLAGCVWWWNPLFWYVRHQLRENAELACDAWVVQTLPASRRGYAEALVAVCESMCDRVAIQKRAPAAPMPALGIGTGGRRFMERRLVMILRDQVALRLPRLVMLAVSVLSLAALPAWSQKAAEESDPRVQAQERVAQRLADGTRMAYVRANSAPLPAEAQNLIDRSAEQEAEIRREMARKLNEQRAQLIQQLKELQDKYTKAGQLDEAVAVRDRVRQLEGARVGDRPQGVPLPPRSGPTRFNAQPDPGNLTQFRDKVGESFYFDVTGSTDGSIWGDLRYTDDSALATAAVHAGILQPGQRGVVRVTMLAGRDHYEGTTRNGVTSASYGPWPGSYCIDPVRASTRLRYSAPEPAKDPGTLGDYRDRVGQSLLFITTGSDSGTIWGNGTYTDDSPLAVAAVHAGVLKVGETGVVKVTILPGQDTYGGSERNGITSQPYGSFPGSYRVDSRDADGALLGWTLPKPTAPAEVNLSNFRGQPRKTIVMEITGATGGSVWGTDVYTDDSSIPAAAVHAGVLKNGEKGIVQITTLPGQESYNGSTRNGVESGSWGHWDGSFRVQRHGDADIQRLDLKWNDLGIEKLKGERKSSGGEGSDPPPAEKGDVRSF
ncbi:MAG: blaR1 2 [Phycisphaerales bacterium]|nr:blaR1 2 [Phycisphaerales bacterium]